MTNISMERLREIEANAANIYFGNSAPVVVEMREIANELISLRADNERLQDLVECYESAIKNPGDDQRHIGASVATQLVHCQHKREQAEVEIEQLKTKITQLETEGTPGVMHAVDNSFYKLALSQRDAAWAEIERLREALEYLLDEVDKSLCDIDRAYADDTSKGLRKAYYSARADLNPKGEKP